MSDRNIKKVIIMDIKQIDRCTKYAEIKPQSLPQISMVSQLSKDESYVHCFDSWYIKLLISLNISLLKAIKINC
jgi:hypothetical protein